MPVLTDLERRRRRFEPQTDEKLLGGRETAEVFSYHVFTSNDRGEGFQNKVSSLAGAQLARGVDRGGGREGATGFFWRGYPGEP